ncbi:hypothetical protein FOA52_016080 [Chlamydomonas sp. UWO 241]|nr:hypothetical protein FOA52_016080 [Chlamydomonas sp. UWO 241]
MYASRHTSETLWRSTVVLLLALLAVVLLSGPVHAQRQDRPPLPPGFTSHARFVGPLSAQCRPVAVASDGTADSAAMTRPGLLSTALSAGRARAASVWVSVSVPPPAYGPTAAGTGGCIDLFTGLPTPFALGVQYSGAALRAAGQSAFALSATTSLIAGEDHAAVAFTPAPTLYSVLGGRDAADAAAALGDSDVYASLRGGSLGDARTVLVADARAAAALTLLGAFLAKAAPVLCVPGAGLGGTAVGEGAGDLTAQAARVGTALIEASNIMGGVVTAPAGAAAAAGGGGDGDGGSSAGSSSPWGGPAAAAPVNLTNTDAVIALLASVANAAGCPPALLDGSLGVIVQSATAVARTVALASSAAGAAAESYGRSPIEFALALARVSYAVQARVLPLIESADVGQVTAALSQVLDGGDFDTFVLSALVNDTEVLLALGVVNASGAARPAARAGNVPAAAHGAGALADCRILFASLLTTRMAAATTDVNGVLMMPLVKAGRYTVPPGCTDVLLNVSSRVSYSVALPPGLGKTAHMAMGGAVATARWAGSQADVPSLPTAGMYTQAYESLIGLPTGLLSEWDFLTRTGTKQVTWEASAVHVAAFLVDQVLSAVVACACEFVSAAAGADAHASCVAGATAYMAGVDGVAQFAETVTVQRTLFKLYINATTGGHGSDGSAAGGGDGSSAGAGGKGAPPPQPPSPPGPPPSPPNWLAMYALTKPPPPAAAAAAASTAGGLGLGGALGRSVGSGRRHRRSRALAQVGGTGSAAAKPASGGARLLPPSMIEVLLGSAAAALSSSNALLLPRLAAARQAILDGDLAGAGLAGGASEQLLQAAKVAKVQMDNLGAAVGDLGAAVGVADLPAAQAAAQRLYAYFTGDTLTAAVFNAIVDRSYLPLPCTGTQAGSAACAPPPLPPPDDTNDGGSTSRQVRLGVGLGVGLFFAVAIIGSTVAGTVLLAQRRAGGPVRIITSNKVMPDGQVVVMCGEGQQQHVQLLLATGAPPPQYSHYSAGFHSGQPHQLGGSGATRLPPLYAMAASPSKPPQGGRMGPPPGTPSAAQRQQRMFAELDYEDAYAGAPASPVPAPRAWFGSTSERASPWARAPLTPGTPFDGAPFSHRPPTAASYPMSRHSVPASPTSYSSMVSPPSPAIAAVAAAAAIVHGIPSAPMQVSLPGSTMPLAGSNVAVGSTAGAAAHMLSSSTPRSPGPGAQQSAMAMFSQAGKRHSLAPL